jgi:transcriptional regulator with XRE-family HTH domain
MKFSAAFYKALDYQTDVQRDYKDAFEQARVRLPGRGSGNPSSGSSERKPAKNQARVAVDFVCLLSIAGDLYPDTGFIRSANGGESTDYPGEKECCDDQDNSGGFEGEDDESTRNWREPGVLADGTRVDAATDYAAHAGKAERKCLELLGFSMTLPVKGGIKVGVGITAHGFIEKEVTDIWGVTSYTSGVWGFDKKGQENKAIAEAKVVISSPDGFKKIKEAAEALEEVQKHRGEDMRKHAETRRCLGTCRTSCDSCERLRHHGFDCSALAQARVNKSLSQEDFAKKLRITAEEIQKYESGTAIPPIPIIKNMERELGVKLPRKAPHNCADCKRCCKNCRSRETHEYQLKQITDTREALEKMIQDDLSAGVAALSSDTTRGAGTGWQHAHDGVRRIQMSEASAEALKTANSHTESCAEHHDVKSWGVEQVIAFFEGCKFPTEGVQAGEVDGESLVNLYQDPDAERLFTTPAPDGLGFNKVMFKGKFKKEMEKLVSK